MNLKSLQSAKAKTPSRTNGITDLMEIELWKIKRNPDQPRKNFDPASLAELAESIKSKGLMQPIVVTRKIDGYMIISGERRYRAHQINGSITIRAIVTDRDDLSIEEMALIENIQRVDLTDYEIAMAIVRLWKSGKYTLKTDLAESIAKPLSYVSKAFACLNLDETIKADIEDNKLDIGLSVLQELSRVEPDKQPEVFEQYKAGEITRDQFKEAASGPKVSRGKKHIPEAILSGSGIEVVRQFLEHSFAPNIKYKITIEEIG